MVTIRTQDDLTRDLSRTHRPLARSPSRDSPAIEADFATVQREGYVIIEGLLDAAQVAAIRAASAPHLTHLGRNNFEGLRTQRIYNVLAKTRALDRLADHPRILGLVDRVLLPNYLLSQAQIINIQPGEVAQALHHDDAMYRFPRPRAALGAAVIVAIDDFTADNGATVVIPRSHTWSAERAGTPAEAIPIVMPSGAGVFFLGTTWHGGGANRSPAPRLAATCQYCEPYLRQQESFLLELSRSTVRSLSPELQALVGYSIHPPFIGMVDGLHPRRLLEDGEEE